jgi:alginate O-acetyltransferase complex protein AlgI
MIFTSFEFLIFLGVLLVLFYLSPHRYRWGVLLAGSYFFYAYLTPLNLVYLVTPTVVVYALAVRMDTLGQGGRKRFLLVMGIVAGALFLLVFKYTDFLGNTFNSLFRVFTGKANDESIYEPFKFVLPIGISFYSFKLISYIIDVYNEKLKAERHLGYFALYVSMFPQLLAGPIDRAVHFIPQLKKKVTVDYDRITSGLRVMAWGFFKKLVIADQLAVVVNNVYENVHKYEGIPLLVATVAYSFQIYCDFSGYTDIAIGVSRILGYESMKNFDSPYSSRSIVKFWNNWHISLSTWLRDYLFLPIAYAVMRRIKSPRLAKIKVETWGYVCGMFITMFLGGLWHGAHWNFVIWGAVHGLFLIVSFTTKKTRKRLVAYFKLKKYPGIHTFIRVTATFGMVTFAWIFFRADSIADALYIITHLHVGVLTFLGNLSSDLIFNFSLQPLTVLAQQLGISAFGLNKIVIAVAVLEAVQLVQRRTGNLNGWFVRKSMGYRWGCYFILLVLIVYWGQYDIKEFIYFQF